MSDFARVAVNIAQIHQTYDYAIPADLQRRVQPGSLVTVPFGKQLAQGIVVSMLDEPEVAETKDIESLVDEIPVVTPVQIDARRLVGRGESRNVACLSRHDASPRHQPAHRFSAPSAQQAGKPEELSRLQSRLVALLEKRGDLRGRQVDALMPGLNWRQVLPPLIRKLIHLLLAGPSPCQGETQIRAHCCPGHRSCK